MHSFQFLFRASGAILIFNLCLKLATNNAQKNSEVIRMNLIMPEVAKVNEKVTINLQFETDLKECMGLKVQLLSSIPIETAFTVGRWICVCSDYQRNLYWRINVYETMYVIAYVDIVPNAGICPENEAVVPIAGISNNKLKKITVIV